LQVRAWDARLGDSYEEVEALGIGGYGESQPFFAQGGVPGQLLPDLPGELIGLQSFRLRAIVPEPSSGTLLALGIGVLWCRLTALRLQQRREVH
ncbi:MAG: PEP-CTERM sorting domain-containing protein, partial [bacterium]